MLHALSDFAQSATGGGMVSEADEDAAVFHAEFDSGGSCRVLQCGIQHDDGIWSRGQSPQQTFALLTARRENDFQTATLAFYRRAVGQLQIHRLDVGIHIVDAHAALISGVLGKFLPRAGIHVT